MSGFTLTLDETPDPEQRKAILAPLRKYNANWIGEPVVQPLAIFIRDPKTDEIVGGLWGQSAAGWLFVDLLFVPENLRRRRESIDLPPLNWSSLKYGFDQGGLDRWQGRGTRQKR